MEDTAIQTLQKMLTARKIQSVEDVKPISTKDTTVDKTSIFSIGPVLVIFSKKERGIMEKDLKSYIAFASNNNYNAGLIIVLMVPPSDSIKQLIRASSHNHVHVFHIRELQFDITTHRLWVPHRILKEEEENAIFEKYKISSPETQLPWISSQDKAARWIGAVPDDVIEVTRHSDTAGKVLYYRYCVEDENIS